MAYWSNCMIGSDWDIYAFSIIITSEGKNQYIVLRGITNPRKGEKRHKGLKFNRTLCLDVWGTLQHRDIGMSYTIGKVFKHTEQLVGTIACVTKEIQVR